MPYYSIATRRRIWSTADFLENLPCSSLKVSRASALKLTFCVSMKAKLTLALIVCWLGFVSMHLQRDRGMKVLFLCFWFPHLFLNYDQGALYICA